MPTSILLLIDAERGLKGDAEAILDRLKDVRQPKVLVLNKVDRVKPEDAAEARRRRPTRASTSSAPSWSRR